MTYTRGPWKCISAAFKKGGVIAWEIIMPNGGVISKSNADLIAAAPDLYEALKEIYAALISEPITDADDGEACWLLKPSKSKEAMRKALAAIAKAEGK